MEGGEMAVSPLKLDLFCVFFRDLPSDPLTASETTSFPSMF
jgi:hypothetical protein